jgi:hypothetical protein
MIGIVPLSKLLVQDIADLADREFLDPGEYNFITEEELKAKLSGSLLQNISHNGEPNTLVAVKKERPLGYISYSENSFDTLFFGFPCYTLGIKIFSRDYEEVQAVSHILSEGIEKLIRAKSGEYHLSLGLNNNYPNTLPLFNTLTSAGFTFISTLLTFSLTARKLLTGKPFNSNIRIRTAVPGDAGAVSSIAERSFQFSRFHMDPYLDNAKADRLLKVSAENSILKGFADIMFIAEVDNKIAGYYSGKKKRIDELNRTFGTAIISAVDPDYRGMGIFSLLDDHLLDWFSCNCDFSEMGTYLGNFPVHKTWITKGLPLIRGTYQFSKFVSAK